MKYPVDHTLILGVDASFEHVLWHHIQPVVEDVVTLMKYSTNPTLFLDSDESNEVISSMQSEWSRMGPDGAQSFRWSPIIFDRWI
jgi:hypothetical protein